MNQTLVSMLYRRKGSKDYNKTWTKNSALASWANYVLKYFPRWIYCAPIIRGWKQIITLENTARFPKPFAHGLCCVPFIVRYLPAAHIASFHRTEPLPITCFCKTQVNRIQIQLQAALYMFDCLKRRANKSIQVYFSRCCSMKGRLSWPEFSSDRVRSFWVGLAMLRWCIF